MRSVVARKRRRVGGEGVYDDVMVFEDEVEDVGMGRGMSVW